MTEERPAFKYGDAVTFPDEFGHPLSGTVLAVKHGRRGWWVEIRTVSGLAYYTPAEFVTPDGPLAR